MTQNTELLMITGSWYVGTHEVMDQISLHWAATAEVIDYQL